MAEVSIHDPEGTTPSEEKGEKDIWPMTREETRAFTLDGRPGAGEGVLKVTAVGYDGPEVEVPAAARAARAGGNFVKISFIFGCIGADLCK